MIWSISMKSCWNQFESPLSERNEDGKVQAGTHLIIMDDLSCNTTIAKSNPLILNYYRQLLIKGIC